jgi:succinate dehydrogenase/fumarate reductase flavoprotein subunit
MSESVQARPRPVRTFHTAKVGQVAARESARPSRELRFDAITDVVIVGGGAGGLTTALFTRWLGDEVTLLEKAAELGGTSVKASFIYWIPNNGLLREAGHVDAEEDFLRFASRTMRPEKYDPDSPTFGQAEWEFDLLKAFYETAWPAVKLLNERGALRYRHASDWPDYWYALEVDKTKYGRALAVAGSEDVKANGGAIAIASLVEAATDAGIELRTGHRVQRLILDGERIAGVVATTADGATLRFGARKGVVFASGGFTHDAELRENFLHVPVVHGCAAVTNEGDFVRIGSTVGAQLRNMQYAWYAPSSVDKAADPRPDFNSTCLNGGDSMIGVNYKGERCLNEKLPYNELVQRMYAWDTLACEAPNRVIFLIWDQHTQDNSAADYYGNLVVPDDVDQSHVVRADTLAELAAGLSERLDRLRALTGSLELAPDFVQVLEASIERWNELARKGVDEDFHRGERDTEVTLFAGPVADEPDKRNPVMWPISPTGPYYASMITGGTLDTKGGPKVNVSSQVVDDVDEPIAGLYAVGNCAASAAGRAYWAGGATLGPIIAQAYRAAQAIHTERAQPLI